MNKKGDTQKILFYIFYIFIAVIIIYVTTTYLSNYFNGFEFNKEFMAKDMGLAIDTLSFSPSKIEMKYNFFNEFSIENKDFVLGIKLKDLEFPKRYNFISKIDDFSIKTNELNIIKKEKIIIS